MSIDDWTPPRLKRLLDEVLEEKHRSAPESRRDDFIHAGGVSWRRGDRFHFRTWLGLKLIDRDAAKTYFQTTS